MQLPIVRILVVCADADERRTLLRRFEDVAFARFSMHGVADGSEAIMLSKEWEPDLVLYDVCAGMPVLEEMQAYIRTQPAIQCLAVADISNRQEGERALAIGALQYCLKEQLLADVLLATALLARRRGRGLDELDSMRDDGAVHPGREWWGARQKQPDEPSDEEAMPLADAPPEAKAAPQPETLPGELYEHFSRRFMDLLELSLERQFYRVNHDTAEALEALAKELCQYQAGPRDAVELFSNALNAKRILASDEKYKAYAQEGRLLLMELLGYMVRWYRSVACAEASSATQPASLP